MRKLVILLTLVLALFSVSAFATTQDFNAFGTGTGLGFGQAENLGYTSLAFPDFTLNTIAYTLQLDAPGYFGASAYELLGNGNNGQGTDLTIDFNAAQNNFGIGLRDFLGYGGTDIVTVYGADDTTVLATYSLALNGSIITFTDNGESAPIGAVNLSQISGEQWSGILQCVSYGPGPGTGSCTPATSTPEPGSLALFGTGVLGLAGMIRRRLSL